MGGDQLQPGEEDGGTGTPTEVVAQENPKKKKTRKSKKKQMIREHWRWGIPSPNLIWW